MPALCYFYSLQMLSASGVKGTLPEHGMLIMRHYVAPGFDENRVMNSYYIDHMSTPTQDMYREHFIESPPR